MAQPDRPGRRRLSQDRRNRLEHVDIDDLVSNRRAAAQRQNRQAPLRDQGPHWVWGDAQADASSGTSPGTSWASAASNCRVSALTVLEPRVESLGHEHQHHAAGQRGLTAAGASPRPDPSFTVRRTSHLPLHESPPALRPPVTLPQPCLRTMTWALLADGDWGVGACSQAAAHERQVGQTYLRVGNLVEARKHLARAEQLLQIETPSVYDVPTTAAREHAHKSRLHGQGPSPARPPPRHAPGGSGRLSTYRGRARATARPPDASGS